MYSSSRRPFNKTVVVTINAVYGCEFDVYETSEGAPVQPLCSGGLPTAPDTRPGTYFSRANGLALGVCAKLERTNQGAVT